jgi:hypothetical protein
MQIVYNKLVVKIFNLKIKYKSPRFILYYFAITYILKNQQILRINYLNFKKLVNTSQSL